jgi:hypothetical protein
MFVAELGSWSQSLDAAWLYGLLTSQPPVAVHESLTACLLRSIESHLSEIERPRPGVIHILPDQVYGFPPAPRFLQMSRPVLLAFEMYE